MSGSLTISINGAPARFSSLVEHWQRTGEGEARRTRIDVRRRAEVRRAAAKGFCARLQLNVHLESNDHLVPFAAHRCASAPSDASSAYATLNIVYSSKWAV